MFFTELPINLFMLVLAMIGSGFIGFSLRTRQLKMKNVKIVELRKEMVNNHAYILELQKEYVDLETQCNQGKTPVLAMKNAVKVFERQNQELMDSAR